MSFSIYEIIYSYNPKKLIKKLINYLEQDFGLNFEHEISEIIEYFQYSRDFWKDHS